MIEVRKLYKYYNDRAVIDEVSFDLDLGELVGLVGPSGGGKSVLLKIMASVIQPDAGEVIYDIRPNRGEAEAGTPATDTVRSVEEIHVGFLFQEGALFDSMTVLENVAFPLRVEKDVSYSKGKAVEFSETTARSDAMDRAYEMLCDVGLREACKKYPGQISGGMRRRVGIARALVSHPDLVLFDDPTGGLDPVAASVIMELIKELHSKYSPTVVLSSHDIRRLLPAVGRLLALFEGRVVSDVKVSEILNKAPTRVVDFLKTRFDFEVHLPGSRADDVPPVGLS